MKTLRTVSVILILLAAAVSPAAAAPILVYNSFGPDPNDHASEPDNASDTFHTQSVTPLSDSLGPTAEAACSFTPSMPVTFHSVEVAWELDQGTPQIAGLRPDVGGLPGPTALESFTFTPGPTPMVFEGTNTLTPPP